MQSNSLVIFKGKPAQVVAILDKKVEIVTEDTKSIKLPEKNLFLLFEGGFTDLKSLKTIEATDFDDAWEIIQGQTTTLAELCELAYGEYTPNSAYSAWQIIQEGIYFRFEEENIIVHDRETAENIIKERQQKADKEQALADFTQRLQQKQVTEQDAPFLKEIANLALGRTTSCRFFKALGMEETPQNAHKLLLDLGYWDEFVNPHPERFGVKLINPEISVPALAEIARRDLTHLESFAIDDADSTDPDDAISWDADEQRLWVHVADPASIVTPDSEIDIEARQRGTNLYLPEMMVTMLPEAITHQYALGLAETSPALSIGFRVDDNGNVYDETICLSTVKVTRLSYENAENDLNQEHFSHIRSFAKAFNQKRYQNDAVELQFPEIKIKMRDQVVQIEPLAPLKSRNLVRDAMLMAGVAVAQYAQAHNIPMPFSTQEQHELSPEECRPRHPSEMFAVRKKLKKGMHKSFADCHAGMGLEGYVQATSPLRRYLDLVVHQQLHRHLSNQPLLNGDDIMLRIASVEQVVKEARQTESYTNNHWKCVYLMQNPDWSGKATIIEKQGNRITLSIPELDLIKKMALSQGGELDEEIQVCASGVKLHSQDMFFKESFE